MLAVIGLIIVIAIIYFVRKYRKEHAAEIAKRKKSKLQHKANLKKQREADEIRYRSLKDEFKHNGSQKFDKCYFDSNSRRIFKDKSMFAPYKIINYSDIIGFRPIEQGHSKTKKHGITRAIVGGALAGGIGAVVGATTGGKNFDYIDKLGVSIALKNNQNLEIMFIKTSTKKGFLTDVSYEDYSKLCALLNGITATNK